MIAKLPGPDQWLQYLTLAMSAFLIIYMLTYVGNERERNDCREAVDRALIAAITGRAPATTIREDAFDRLLDGLLASPPPDADTRRRMVEEFREARRTAASIRSDNPFPSPTCD